MIGLIRGRIFESQPPYLMVDVNGIGYEIMAPMSTFYSIPNDREDITLYTHLVVREDSHSLFGFIKQRDKTLFKLLIKASGVGPKLALAILSGIGTDEFVSCIHAGDVTALVRIPGIGKKTAERLVIELADRLNEWEYEPLSQGINTLPETAVLDQAVIGSIARSSDNVDSDVAADGTYAVGESQNDRSVLTQHQLRRDSESALISLGYKPHDAAKAVKAVLAADMTREEVIRQALQRMVKRTVAI